ncbi:MAG: hypothetical protein ACJA08_001899 [Cyclobacteriaceae bacterium]|jgi:hypothetical protein
MSKKLISVSIDKINEYFSNDHYLNFVMINSSVTLAKPLSLKSDILKVKNTRGRKMDLPLSQIAEIWAEEKVST